MTQTKLDRLIKDERFEGFLIVRSQASAPTRMATLTWTSTWRTTPWKSTQGMEQHEAAPTPALC